MTSNELRQAYLNFFKEKGHVIIPSASLLPENDPTTLFTSSGMQPMVPYLLGEIHPNGTRITDSQKSFRTQDIEEVGDNRHTTFFEMLGNWSLGDYFKAEQIPWMFEFLTKTVGLNPEKLFVTCFRGKEEIGIPKDEEAAELWQKQFKTVGLEAKIVDFPERDGLQNGRIFFYDEKKNWWSRAGITEKMPVGEPGGPDSEMFWDFGAELNLHENSQWKNEPCHVNCDCGRFMEIGNNVFMAYKKTESGFEPLKNKNVDFGGGLERIATALNGDPDMFKIDLFAGPLKLLEELSGKKYNESEKTTYAFRVILDHLRAATFLIGDGALPSNKDQGYFTRRLIRRSVRFARDLNIQENFCAKVGEIYIDEYQVAYPDLKNKKAEVLAELEKEEKRFRETLENGLREFNKMVNSALLVDANQTKKIEVLAKMPNFKDSNLKFYFEISSQDIHSDRKITGMFPLRGPDLISLKEEVGVITIEGLEKKFEPILGAKQQTIAAFKLKVGTFESVGLQKIKLNVVKAEDHSCYNLVDNNGVSLSIGDIALDSVTFKLDNLFLEAGVNANFFIKADIGGEINDSIVVGLDERIDVLAIGAKSNFAVDVINNYNQTGVLCGKMLSTKCSFSIIKEGSKIGIKKTVEKNLKSEKYFSKNNDVVINGIVYPGPQSIRSKANSVPVLGFTISSPEFSTLISQIAVQFTGEIPTSDFDLYLFVDGRRISNARSLNSSTRKVVFGFGIKAFDLYSTYGFPIELIEELLRERGIFLDSSIFEEQFRKHQELSRSGAEQKFAGGLADHSVETTKLHTATHLLQAALRKILGPHVFQKGSNITVERLRFDFSHPEKVTSEQLEQVEQIVNQAIEQNLPVNCQMMDLAEAKAAAAIGVFDDKYEKLGGQVKVYTIAPSTSSGQAGENSVSREVCGGPHVEKTGDLGHFKIIKEEAVSAGVRRIKAVLA